MFLRLFLQLFSVFKDNVICLTNFASTSKNTCFASKERCMKESSRIIHSVSAGFTIIFLSNPQMNPSQSSWTSRKIPILSPEEVDQMRSAADVHAIMARRPKCR